jgi:2,4-diaminopentanoate dehydrogenase
MFSRRRVVILPNAAIAVRSSRVPDPQPLRTVVWSTGGVGAHAVGAVADRPDLDLVGVWVHAPAKEGVDAGTLVGREELGVVATRDADALIALRPDCVVYAASGPDRDAAAVPDYVRLLRAGINIVTTTSTGLIYPPAYYSDQWRAELEAAATAGGATLYASGIFPGFASDELALVLATQSRRIDRLTVTEISLNDHYPVADIMRDGMGFGMPLEFTPLLQTPGFIEMAWRAPIRLIADALGAEVTEVRGEMDRRVTDRDIAVAFGTIPAGTCGAVRTRAVGVVGGREGIVVEHLIRMSRDVAPDWPSSDNDATYLVEVEGDPDIHCTLSLGEAEGPGAGSAAMAATAMRVVNAIPFVVDAPSGLLSSSDLPMTLPRGVFGTAAS